jgi:hypothetical protein
VAFLSIISFRLFLSAKTPFVALALITCLLPFNNFYQRFILLAFTGQLYSLGFVAISFFLECFIVSRRRFEARACMLLLFFLSANSLAYIEGMVFPLLPVFALVPALAFGRRYDRVSCLKNAGFVGLIFSASHIPIFFKLVEMLKLHDASPPAFAMNMPTFFDLAGLQGFFAPSWFLPSFVFVNVIFIILLVYQARKEGITSFLSMSLLVFLATHLALCARYFSLGEASSYTVFKSALSMAFIVYIFLLRLGEPWMEGIIRDIRRGGFRLSAQNTAVALSLMAWLVLQSVGTSLLGRFAGAKDAAITSDGDIVRFYAQSPSYGDSDFIVNSDLPIQSRYIEYCCPMGRAYSSSYGGSASDAKRLMKDSIKEGDFFITSTQEKSLSAINVIPLASNESYNVYRISGGSMILFDYRGLAHGITFYADYGKLTCGRRLLDDSDAVEFEYMAVGEVKENFYFKFFDFNESHGEFAIKAFLNGEAIGAFGSRDREAELELANLRLAPGKNVFRLEFEIDGEKSDVMLMSINYE